MEAPVLPYPDPASPYLLDTDASAEGLGAVLSQVKDGKEHVVAYYSSKFTGPERNYCVTRKELLAVVRSLDHFHPYLYGARFTIRTDHAALQWLKTLKAPEGQLARWLGRMEQYQYEVKHRPGRVHNNADSLSRRPCEPECPHCSRREERVVCRRLQVWGDAEEAETPWRRAQRELGHRPRPFDQVDGIISRAPQLAGSSAGKSCHQTSVAAVGHASAGGWSTAASLGRHSWADELLGGVGTALPQAGAASRAAWRRHQWTLGRKEDPQQTETAILLGGHAPRRAGVVPCM